MSRPALRLFAFACVSFPVLSLAQSTADIRIERNVPMKTRDGVTLPVVYRQCIVPDTFRDRAGKDLDVGLEGELQEDGVFEATELFARCTGGYVMGQQSE